MRVYGRAQVKYELPCERAVRAVFPSIRAVITKILTEEYGLNRYTVAKVLGMTPAAVTLYMERRRGDKYVAKIISSPEISLMVRKTAEDFFKAYNERGYVGYQLYQAAFCNICSRVNELALNHGCPSSDLNGGDVDFIPRSC